MVSVLFCHPVCHFASIRRIVPSTGIAGGLSDPGMQFFRPIMIRDRPLGMLLHTCGPMLWVSGGERRPPYRVPGIPC